MCACAAIVTFCAYDHIGITIAVHVAREVDPVSPKNATSVMKRVLNLCAIRVGPLQV
jgi:hypothetical protein